MKYPQSPNKSIYIREVYEDTYRNINEYIIDTMIWENRVDELHTICCKGKDPHKEKKMTKPTDEELDGFIEGYLSDGMDWWYDKEIVRGLARALLEHFGENETN